MGEILGVIMRGVRYWGNNERGEILGVIMNGMKYWG